MTRHPFRTLVPAAAFVLIVSAAATAAASPGPAEVYRNACAACHGADGRGASADRVGFAEPLPDFTDCSFATREPNADWFAVSHDGGPARAFARMMPAFGEAMSDEQIDLALAHVRTFCPDDRWPYGELNLPRPLVTEKAFPEDEAVITSAVATDGPGAVANRFVYEKRIGPRGQIEVVVPFAWEEREVGAPGALRQDWTGGLGDLAIGYKRALFVSHRHGSILSVTAEAKLPTGDEDDGFGKGTTVLEPFVTFGQILPAESFLQFQGGVEIPLDDDKGNEEAFWRLALGKSFTEGRFGRTWSPMVEMLGWRELVSGESVHWDVVPQVQVTLSTRQHLMANVGARLPLDDTDVRDPQLVLYLLWDWFDGGLFDGW